MAGKYTINAILPLAFLLLFVPAATGNGGNPTPGSSAACHVFIDVDPNVAIMPLQPDFEMGSIQAGAFTGTIAFRIDANTQRVRIWTAASNLYKGDVFENPEVAPIPIDYNLAIEILPESASPVGGEDNRAEYIRPHDIEGYSGFETERIEFESAQNNHFSQRVDMVVGWEQDDPEKPMGEYSGRVKMLAEVVLPVP